MKPCSTTMDTLKKLVDEEREDSFICQMMGSPLTEKLQRLKKKPQSRRLLEETLDQSIPGEHDDETMKSDLVASLLDGEERGMIDTSRSPLRTYETLFPPLADEPTVNVSPASPAPLHDIVVPVGEAGLEDVAIVTEELSQAMNDDQGAMPEGNMYAATMARMRDDEGEKRKHEKEKEKERAQEEKMRNSGKDKDDTYIRKGVLQEERAPWEIALGSLEDLVGGKMSMLSTGETLPSDESIRATAGRFEYILEYKRPDNYSCVQLRGSQPPIWFPGYYSVFSYNTNYVKLERSPSRTLATAWNLFSPQAIAENSEIVIT